MGETNQNRLDQWEPLRERVRAYMEDNGVIPAALARQVRVKGATLLQFLGGRKSGLSLKQFAGLARVLGEPMEALLPENMRAAVPPSGTESKIGNPSVQKTAPAIGHHARQRLRALAGDILEVVREAAIAERQAQSPSADRSGPLRRGRKPR